MAVVHTAVRGTRLRDWHLQQLPGNEGTLLAVQALMTAVSEESLGKRVENRDDIPVE